MPESLFGHSFLSSALIGHLFSAIASYAEGSQHMGVHVGNSEVIKEQRAAVPSSRVWISPAEGPNGLQVPLPPRSFFSPKSSAFSFIKLWANLMFEDDLPVYVPNFGAIRLYSWSLQESS